MEIGKDSMVRIIFLVFVIIFQYEVWVLLTNLCGFVFIKLYYRMLRFGWIYMHWFWFTVLEKLTDSFWFQYQVRFILIPFQVMPHSETSYSHFFSLLGPWRTYLSETINEQISNTNLLKALTWTSITIKIHKIHYINNKNIKLLAKQDDLPPQNLKYNTVQILNFFPSFVFFWFFGYLDSS
jgi:hypothetical protein